MQKNGIFRLSAGRLCADMEGACRPNSVPGIGTVSLLSRL